MRKDADQDEGDDEEEEEKAGKMGTDNVFSFPLSPSLVLSY